MGYRSPDRNTLISRLLPGLAIVVLLTGCASLEPLDPIPIETVPIAAETPIPEGYIPALIERSPDERLTAWYIIWDQHLDGSPSTGSLAYLFVSDNATQQTVELADFRNRRSISLLHWESTDTLRVVNGNAFIWLDIEPLPGHDNSPQVTQIKKRGGKARWRASP